MLLISLILLPFFALQLFFLGLLIELFNKSQKLEVKKYLDQHQFLYFYTKLYSKFYKNFFFNGLYESTLFCKSIASLAFGFCSYLFLQALMSFKLDWTSLSFILAGLAVVYILIHDLFPRLFTIRKAKKYFLYGAFLCSLYQSILLVILYPFLKILQYSYTKQSLNQEYIKILKEKMYDLLKETLPNKNLEANDRMLIESILKFKERIVREVMVPRMDVFALSVDTPIKEAARILKEENYSRIPVYKESLDHIEGLILYKDVYNYYLDSLENKQEDKLNRPISELVTKALYTPETRKISHLLQEFLQKQQHLALVVDEFGAIEGIITIEDLLEEIVGEIADEYDEEENLYEQQQNSWIVDGRMSLFDIEQNCHVKIPRIGDYDTIGGYIIHRSGNIPPPNLKISHDDFELLVLSTTDRQIKKVRITPRKQ